MDDGMMSTVQVPHLECDDNRCGVIGSLCRRRCCKGHSDDDRHRGCTAVLCGSVCTKTMLVIVNLTFFVSTVPYVYRKCIL